MPRRGNSAQRLCIQARQRLAKPRSRDDWRATFGPPRKSPRQTTAAQVEGHLRAVTNVPPPLCLRSGRPTLTQSRGPPRW
jgi:hypothetical protein